MTTFSVNDFVGTALQIGGGYKEGQSIEFFEYKSMKSVSIALQNDGNWYVIINFIANDKINPLRINLSLVSNQEGWTNDYAGATNAIADIQTWMSQNLANATIVSPLGSLESDSSVSVTLAKDQYGLDINPNIIVSSGDFVTIIASKVYSISFASNGTADALVSFDGGGVYVALPPGTTVNMDAGGINNTYKYGQFAYNTDTNAGASLIITYNNPSV